jgi:hypothetical protein
MGVTPQSTLPGMRTHAAANAPFLHRAGLKSRMAFVIGTLDCYLNNSYHRLPDKRQSSFY